MNTLKIINRTFSFQSFLGAALLCVSQLSLAAPLLNGVATHTELGSEKFIAALYTPTLTTSAKQVLDDSGEKKIEVRVLEDRMSARRFKRMWIEGIAINSNTTELETQAQNMAAFSNMLKVKLIKDDIFTVEKLPNFVKVSINGIEIGQIEDPSFFDVLLRTWVGFVPLSSDFRDSLLVEGSVSSDVLTRFEAIQPSQERITALEDALAGREQREQLAAANVPDAEKSATKPRVALPPENLKVALAAPKIDAPKIESPAENSVAAAPKPKPKPEPVRVALPPQQEELDESIFEEDEADVEFTAEGLLIEQLYYSRLANYTQNFARYPRIARERGREGSLLVRVTIDRGGEVVGTEFIEETDSRSLNKEAEKAVKRASPFPPMPKEINGEEFSFTFRLTFNLASRDDVKRNVATR